MATTQIFIFKSLFIITYLKMQSNIMQKPKNHRIEAYISENYSKDKQYLYLSTYLLIALDKQTDDWQDVLAYQTWTQLK